MTTFKVRGGIKLKGDLHPQGAKNEALQVLCSVLLTPEEVRMENVPNIRDVNILIDLLRDLNVKVNQLNESTYTFKANNVDVDYLSSEDYKTKSSRIRGSIMIVGPLLETKDVKKIQGVQLLGEIIELKGEEINNATKRYLKEFPYGQNMKLYLWEMKLTFIKMTYNKLGFGKKLIWEK